VGSAIPGISTGPTEVIRLVTTSAGTAALVSTGSGATTSLHALWSSDGLRSWTASAGLPFSGATLISTGVTADGGWVIAGSRPRRGAPARAMVAATIGPSGAHWQTLAPPPVGTSAVAATPDGSFEALLGHGSTLTVDRLGPTAWSRAQVLEVPVQYGSSG
jgi:hypothetical protein